MHYYNGASRYNQGCRDCNSCRKGRTGTIADDVVFPKGKENLASVLKHYKRRLSNKLGGAHEGSALRKVPTSAPSFRLIQAGLTFDCYFLTQ
jgi:hypothetical protein